MSKKAFKFEHRDVAENIRTARLECNMTQAQLAHEIGYSLENYSNIERKKRKTIDGQIIGKISDVLGVSCDRLIKGEDSAETEVGLQIETLGEDIIKLEQCIRRLKRKK